MNKIVVELLRIADIVAERTTPDEKKLMKRYYKKNHVKILKQHKTRNRTIPLQRREQKGGATHQIRKKYRKYKRDDINMPTAASREILMVARQLLDEC